VALIKARLLLDWRQAAAAAAKAVAAAARGHTAARSLGAEVLFYISCGGKNVGEALRLFGLNDKDDALVAVVIGRSVQEVERYLINIYSGIQKFTYKI